MDEVVELSETQAADELDNMFQDINKVLQEAHGKSPEQIQGAINTSLMILNLRIGQIFNRIRNVTPRILTILSNGLNNFWTLVSSLLSSMSKGKIKDWKVTAEMTVAVAPSAKFSFSVTFMP
jgi:hypothetical protein